MRDPQTCPNWDGSAFGCDCSWCITEAMEADMGLDDDDDDSDDECRFCDFGCSSCDPRLNGNANGTIDEDGPR